MTNDGFHAYTYDAEGNILTVDSSGVQYIYDALNRRIRAQSSASTYEYLYDYAGRRTSSWLNPSSGNPGTGNEGRIYWDGQQIAYRAWDGTTYFDQQNYLGTESLRTNDAGAVVSTYPLLPWGDGSSATYSGTGANQDNAAFAGLDADINSAGAPMSDHAQFRNYSFYQGRWMSPDPYDGSYDFTNPQSFNRYAYVLNNPLSYTDTSGECAEITAGITQGPNTASGQALISIAAAYGANVAFPYAGLPGDAAVANIVGAGIGLNQGATDVASAALAATLAGSAQNAGAMQMQHSMIQDLESGNHYRKARQCSRGLAA